LSYSHRRVLL